MSAMKPESQNLTEERIIDTRSVYAGRIIKLDVLTVDMGNGATAQREVIRHPGAAAILAELPDGRFVLVEQFRRAVGKRMIEVVAGCLEPGEEPAACARREVEEETGYKVGELIPLGQVYASPGFVCECLHLFYARLDAAAGQQALDEDERVRPLFLKAEQIEARIADGSIEDSKTLSCWLLDRMRRKRTE